MLFRQLFLKKNWFFEPNLHGDRHQAEKKSHLSRTRHSEIPKIHNIYRNCFVSPKVTFIYVSKCTKSFTICILLFQDILYFVCRVRDKIDYSPCPVRDKIWKLPKFNKKIQFWPNFLLWLVNLHHIASLNIQGIISLFSKWKLLRVKEWFFPYSSAMMYTANACIDSDRHTLKWKS